ncbi:MAG: type I-E CRISPR-associated protein Cse1/CasA [Clostridia bacterium]|nr:type I-E CRISPR-associated protein Cse1/CasA [Clostridia bacterium]
MNEIEFNLIDEPWIRVMDSNCNVSEVSLKDAILNAHNYKSLSGELPTQDIAVMRLVLAVLHTVYSRADENGNECPLEDNEEEAVDRWKALWKKGRFSEKAIDDYFEKWHERFWLFHPERPFGQVAGLTIGTDYDAPKLNGEISESSNKVRFFSMYSGNEKSSLTYPQAARWLLYLNAYDDTSSKPTKEGKAKAGGSLPSPGVGWLGKLGLIYITGNNLFETLMLNLILVNENKVQENQNPLWEQEKVSDAERTEIALPYDLAALYTLQSRRILLIRKDNKVVSYKLLGGDFFEKENAFFEPMTVWSSPKKDNGVSSPKRHDSSKQMWREFSVLFEEKENKQAGVVRWFKNYLRGKNLIPRSFLLKTSITSVEYGDKDFFVKNVFSDSLTMHAELLSEIGANWRAKIETEIDRCGKLANAIAYLAQNLYVASGGSDSKKDKHFSEIPNVVKSQLYYRFDLPFREWLRSIDPLDDEKQKYDKQLKWQSTARRITELYAQELIAETSETAITGHREGDIIYSSPKAMIIFRGQMKKIYGKEGDNNV